MSIEKRAESIMICIANIYNTGGVIQNDDFKFIANQVDGIKKETAQVQPVNRWINVDESLPVYDGLVLVYDTNKNIRLGIYTDIGWCSQFGNPMMCKITHWQSLPKPPVNE